MTNTLYCLLFAAQTLTNWQDAGTVMLNGVKQQVRIGIVETNYTTTLVFEDERKVLSFSQRRTGLPLVTCESLTNATILINSGSWTNSQGESHHWILTDTVLLDNTVTNLRHFGASTNRNL